MRLSQDAYDFLVATAMIMVLLVVWGKFGIEQVKDLRGEENSLHTWTIVASNTSIILFGIVLTYVGDLRPRRILRNK